MSIESMDADCAKAFEKLERELHDVRAEKEHLLALVEALRKNLNDLKATTDIAWELCMFTKHHAYPDINSPDFQKLTELLDRLDSSLRWRKAGLL